MLTTVRCWLSVWGNWKQFHRYMQRWVGSCLWKLMPQYICSSLRSHSASCFCSNRLKAAVFWNLCAWWKITALGINTSFHRDIQIHPYIATLNIWTYQEISPTETGGAYFWVNIFEDRAVRIYDFDWGICLIQKNETLIPPLLLVQLFWSPFSFPLSISIFLSQPFPFPSFLNLFYASAPFVLCKRTVSQFAIASISKQRCHKLSNRFFFLKKTHH